MPYFVLNGTHRTLIRTGHIYNVIFTLPRQPRSEDNAEPSTFESNYPYKVMRNNSTTVGANHICIKQKPFNNTVKFCACAYCTRFSVSWLFHRKF